MKEFLVKWLNLETLMGQRADSESHAFSHFAQTPQLAAENRHRATLRLGEWP